jgi:phosphoribosylanthranilate isomerase
MNCRPTRVRIKICGITRLEDALCAVEAGVDALGFIFYDRSSRNIETASARAIIEQLPPFIDKVGVFVDEPADTVLAIINQCRLTYAQLHGAEEPAYCREVGDKAGSCRILKALRVGPDASRAIGARYNASVAGYVLDTYQQGVVGGTGITFDWHLIKELGLTRPYLLAGGLHPGNIREALLQVAPYGVDANSGLETAPGIKQRDLIEDFVRQVRAFERQSLAGQQ